MDIKHESIVTKFRKSVWCVVILTPFFLLYGCGFKSLYYSDSINPIALVFDQIKVEPVKSIAGVEYNTEFRKLLMRSNQYVQTPKKYRLVTEFVTSNFPLVISKESDVILYRLTLKVSYKLFDENDNEVTSSSLALNSSYNTIYSAFGSYVEEQHALKMLAIQAANEVYNKLFFYFQSIASQDNES